VAIYSRPDDYEQLMQQTERAVFEATQHDRRAEWQPLKALLGLAMDSIEARLKGCRPAGVVPTGLDLLDHALGGGARQHFWDGIRYEPLSSPHRKTCGREPSSVLQRAAAALCPGDDRKRMVLPFAP